MAYAELLGRLSADPLAQAGADSCSIRVVRVPPGPRTPHRHPLSVEVVYVAEGAGRLWEDENVTAVRAGDVALIPPGTRHATVCRGPSDLVLVCFFPHPDLSANIEELGGPVRR
jgi:quercetin dioxygenase-like cupin family protein